MWLDSYFMGGGGLTRLRTCKPTNYDWISFCLIFPWWTKYLDEGYSSQLWRQTLKDFHESQKTASNFQHFEIKCAVCITKLTKLSWKESMSLDEAFCKPSLLPGSDYMIPAWFWDDFHGWPINSVEATRGRQSGVYTRVAWHAKWPIAQSLGRPTTARPKD